MKAVRILNKEWGKSNPGSHLLCEITRRASLFLVRVHATVGGEDGKKAYKKVKRKKKKQRKEERNKPALLLVSTLGARALHDVPVVHLACDAVDHSEWLF